MDKAVHLFVVNLEYLVPLQEVEPYLEDHVRYLEANYAAGHFLASGPKVPRSGGVILVRGPCKAEVEALIQADPFLKHKIASCEVTEFIPRMTAPELDLG